MAKSAITKENFEHLTSILFQMNEMPVFCFAEYN